MKTPRRKQTIRTKYTRKFDFNSWQVFPNAGRKLAKRAAKKTLGLVHPGGAVSDAFREIARTHNCTQER